MDVLVNPKLDEAIELLSSVPSFVKTIYDGFGNIYCWDGDKYEHREIMAYFSIEDDLYSTAERVYMDFGGVESHSDIFISWEKHIKNKRYIDSKWVG